MSRYQDPKKPDRDEHEVCVQYQIIADILRKYGLKTDIALIEELGAAAKPIETNPDEPYVNSIDTDYFLDDSLMSHIIDDIYHHASQRGWKRCVIRVEQEDANEQTAEEETQET